MSIFDSLLQLLFISCSVLKSNPIQCPKQFYYFKPNDEIQINAQQISHPNDMEYVWDIVNSSGIDLNDILIIDNNNILDIIPPDDVHNGTITMQLSIHSSGSLITKCHVTIVLTYPIAIGIDLGTTYSCIAYKLYHKRDTIAVITDTTNHKYCIPTAIYFPHNSTKIVFGYKATHQIHNDPKNVIYDIKRIIGRRYNDKEVQLFQKTHYFDLIESIHGFVDIIIPNRNNMTISTEQALAAVVIHLIDTATNNITIKHKLNIAIVISIPAMFPTAQRQAIRRIVNLSGFSAQILIPEPSAATISHMYLSEFVDSDQLKSFMVFDFGGGTLDVSILRCTGIHCEVESVSGNNTLGGIDFDHVIAEIIVDKLKKKNITTVDIDLVEILQHSETVKIALSYNNTYTYNYKDEIVIEITSNEFETHPKTKMLLDESIKIVEKLLIHLEMNLRMILMVGGTSNIPAVQKRLDKALIERNYHIKPAIYLHSSTIDPQLMVATGSAIVCGHLVYDSFADVSPETMILDVVPLSIGFEVCRGDTCGLMSIVVKKNSVYPLEVKQSYCQYDGEDCNVVVNLYEGDSEFVVENYLIGSVNVKNLMAMDYNSKCDTFHVVLKIDVNGVARFRVVVHNEDGSDGQVYYMQLSNLNSDSGGELIEIQNSRIQMSSWFVSDEIQKILKTNQYVNCLETEYSESCMIDETSLLLHETDSVEYGMITDNA
eukprot:117998_1